MKEKELYPDMVMWLDNYVKEKYPTYEVITKDTSEIYLDYALKNMGIDYSMINGLKIQIDILSVAKNGSEFKLFFIEAKKDTLVLNNLGQLWIYSKLAQPEEAFLMTPGNFGSIGVVIGALNRRELLNYGKASTIKEIQIVKWDVNAKSPNWMIKLP